MERKNSKIEEIFKEVDGSEKGIEAGLEFELGILLDKGIDKRDETTAEELKNFLEIHPELTFKAKDTLEKSISYRRDVDLLNYVSNVLGKLKNNVVSPQHFANSEIINSKEKAKLKGELMESLKKLEDEESLENVKNVLSVSLKKRPDLRDMFVQEVLDQRIKSLGENNIDTLKSHLLDEVWKFLVNEDYQ